MTDGWEPVVNATINFLEKNPQYAITEDVLWHSVLSTLAPGTEQVILELQQIVASYIDLGLTKAEAIARHLNIVAQQSEAHCRTMAAGVGEAFAQFVGNYKGTAELLAEDTALQKQEPAQSIETATEVQPKFQPTKGKRR